MSFYLVNAPTVINAREFGLYGHSSYIDVIIKSIGGRENCHTYPIEPLGLLSIKAYCESKGIPVRYINGITLFHRREEETFSAIVSAAEKGSPPTLIGFTGSNTVFRENEWLAGECKKKWPGTKVIIGHWFAALNYERVLREHPVFDFACLGDGEATYAELAQALLDGRTNFEDIPGLAWRTDDGTVLHTEPKQLELDILPRPSRDDLGRMAAKGFGGSVYTTRGCPFRCTFCVTGQIAELYGWKKSAYRERSIDLVIEEVDYLVKDFSISSLSIVDDLFLTRSARSRERALHFADELTRRQLKLRWMFNCRVDSIDLSLFRHLYKAGLREIFVGVETGNRQQLEFYNKRVSEQIDVPGIIRQVQDIGIRVIPGMIVFHPEVTLQELEETLDILDLLGEQRLHLLINQAKPYPGTRLHECYKEKGLLDTDWPVAGYLFRDPNIARIREELVALTLAPDMTFSRMKEHLRNRLQHAPEAGLRQGIQVTEEMESN